MVSSDGPTQHHGGVELLYREYPHFAVEAHHQHITDVVRFQLAIGYWHWFIVGCYLSMYDAYSIKQVVRAKEQRPNKTMLMVAEDLNYDITELEGGKHNEAIVVALVDAVL